MNTSADPGFSALPELPQDPAFYQRVLDLCPAPMLVVDQLGHITYANRAMLELGGWDAAAGVGTNVLDYVHPEEADELTEAFLEISGTDSNPARTDDSPMATVYFHLMSSDGTPVPVEVTGVSALHDTVIGGVIYEVRPAHFSELSRRVLTRLAHGAPTDDVLGDVMQLVALPPIDLDATLVELSVDGSCRLIGATDSQFEEILRSLAGIPPWPRANDEPTLVNLDIVPPNIGAQLSSAGYTALWTMGIDATHTNKSYMIVAATRDAHATSLGHRHRLERASELIGVVLLRSHADALLEHAATHDGLTQLPNRAGFSRRLEEAIRESESETAVLFIDLDGFKPINDAYGHAAGDAVLKVVADRLSSVTRSIDLAARLGGDEFAVVLGATPDRPVTEASATIAARRIVTEIAAPIDLGFATVSVSASIGVAVARSATNVDQLLAQADRAMYAAKQSGGNRADVVTF